MSSDTLITESAKIDLKNYPLKKHSLKSTKELIKTQFDKYYIFFIIFSNMFDFVFSLSSNHVSIKNVCRKR